MEYYKNFLRKNTNSKVRIVFGAIFIFIAIAWIFIRIYENESIRIFDWIYSIIFLLNGLVHILEGKGFIIASLFGKAFILINRKSIQYKPLITSKLQSVCWEEIDTINYRSTSIEVICKNQPNLSIPYSKFEYAELQSLKKIISEFHK